MLDSLRTLFLKFADNFRQFHWNACHVNIIFVQHVWKNTKYCPFPKVTDVLVCPAEDCSGKAS
ncbi:unnamed protein product, partial [Brugia timori]|uniref:Secreted protein n=1 Tax=Brugia timori TaxID=42155 RepID=A0A0R3R9U3_9BILA